MMMRLHPPFMISARLLPALRIGDAFLSFDGKDFVLDDKDLEYIIDDFRPGPGSDTQECFRAIFSFMLAAEEGRRYGGENEDLFPPHIVDWICENKDEIEMLSCDIETEALIEENVA